MNRKELKQERRKKINGLKIKLQEEYVKKVPLREKSEKAGGGFTINFDPSAYNRAAKKYRKAKVTEPSDGLALSILKAIDHF